MMRDRKKPEQPADRSKVFNNNIIHQITINTLIKRDKGRSVGLASREHNRSSSVACRDERARSAKPEDSAVDERVSRFKAKASKSINGNLNNQQSSSSIAHAPNPKPQASIPTRKLVQLFRNRRLR